MSNLSARSFIANNLAIVRGGVSVQSQNMSEWCERVTGGSQNEHANRKQIEAFAFQSFIRYWSLNLNFDRTQRHRLRRSYGRCHCWCSSSVCVCICMANVLVVVGVFIIVVITIITIEWFTAAIYEKGLLILLLLKRSLQCFSYVIVRILLDTKLRWYIDCSKNKHGSANLLQFSLPFGLHAPLSPSPQWHCCLKHGAMMIAIHTQTQWIVQISTWHVIFF